MQFMLTKNLHNSIYYNLYLSFKRSQFDATYFSTCPILQNVGRGQIVLGFYMIHIFRSNDKLVHDFD